jgi:hypothetical protein
MKNFNSKIFVLNEIKYKDKNFKPNKKFKQEKNNQVNNINSINKDKYFRRNTHAKNDQKNH